MMKSLQTIGAVGALVTAVDATDAKSIVAIANNQVNNRTLQNKWKLDIEYLVDAKEERSSRSNYIYVSTVLTNDDVTRDFKRRITDGEIFQTYFSMKDPTQSSQMTVKLPAPTENLDVDWVYQDVDVPFYENFICSMQFNEETKNLDVFPKTVMRRSTPSGPLQSVTTLTSLQSCGVMPVYKWMSGYFIETGKYRDGACEGSDWEIDREQTYFKEAEDGSSFEAKCTFKRSFAGSALRKIEFDESIDWMAGYNIYNNQASVFRYVYGYSYESDKRNQGGFILAEATLGSQVALALTVAAVAVTALI